MEITGNIKVIQDIESGTSKSGNEWSKRTVVVTTDEKYPQDLPIEFMGKAMEDIQKFKVGNPVTVNINLRGNEYNGKYYSSINGWKISHTIGVHSNVDQNPARESADLPF